MAEYGLSVGALYSDMSDQEFLNFRYLKDVLNQAKLYDWFQQCDISASMETGKEVIMCTWLACACVCSHAMRFQGFIAIMVIIMYCLAHFFACKIHGYVLLLNLTGYS